MLRVTLSCLGLILGFGVCFDFVLFGSDCVIGFGLFGVGWFWVVLCVCDVCVV